MAQSATVTQKPKMAEELEKMEYEPLLKVEKQLLGWSVGIGIGLLGILYWLSMVLFPGGH